MTRLSATKMELFIKARVTVVISSIYTTLYYDSEKHYYPVRKKSTKYEIQNTINSNSQTVS